VRIVCAGLATVDLVYRAERIPGPDEKAEALSVQVAAGGPATNAAVTAAALGADVTLVTAVGTHPLGALIRADLASAGVTLLDAAAADDRPPPVSAVTVVAGTGQRSIVSRNAGDMSVGVPPGLAAALAGADAVLVDGHHPALALAAARAGRPLVVDAGSWRPVFADVFRYATVVACAASFRHPGDPRVPHLAITHGPDPVEWWSGERSGSIAVPPVAAVDTAGAGDVFHGALAVAVARDPRVIDLVGALTYAIAVAGIRVVHPGPRAWLGDPRLSAAARGRSPGRS
jgi:sugar/nucleoside kinase (ribokinase family)